mmetsp:Transcript_22643/g.40747  ORF Transcript_22643/g.40747 Transcript_22643/m.40747 type:complete len:462 (-) Transcript_22643:865-2250(-)
MVQKRNLLFLVRLTATAAIGGLLFGYDTGVIGGANEFIKEDFGLSPFVQEAVVSVAIAGAVFGSILGGVLADQTGRKPTILVSDFVFCLGALIMGFSPNVSCLILGRFVVGVGVGTAAMVVPIYLAEASPADLRGSVVSVNVLFIVSGQLISYLACIALAPHWRWMLGLAAVPGALQALGMMFLPESPRWLYQAGRTEEAKEVLKLIRLPYVFRHDTSLVQSEINQIQNELKSELRLTYSQQVYELFHSYRMSLLVGIGLQVFQQFIGINTALYYGPQIMERAGFNNGDSEPILASIPLAFVNVIGCCIAVRYIDNIGRRTIMLALLPFIAASLCCMSLALYLVVYGDSSVGMWLALASLVAYLGFFSVGMSSTPWTVNAEIYPMHLRSVANSLATTANWVSNFIVSMSFLSLIDTDAGAVVCWLVFALVCGVAWVFVYWLLPETKGKTLEDVLTLFAKAS